MCLAVCLGAWIGLGACVLKVLKPGGGEMHRPASYTGEGPWSALPTAAVPTALELAAELLPATEVDGCAAFAGKPLDSGSTICKA